jgi:hypothetical protein
MFTFPWTKTYCEHFYFHYYFVLQNYLEFHYYLYAWFILNIPIIIVTPLELLTVNNLLTTTIIFIITYAKYFTNVKSTIYLHIRPTFITVTIRITKR